MFKKEYLLVAGLLLFYFTVLSIVAATTPITPAEAVNFYNSDDISAFLMHGGYSMLHSELGIRLPFLLFSIVSAIFYYQIAKDFLKKSVDVHVSLFIYLFLPGVVASSILASETSMMSMFILMFIYSFSRQYWIPLVLSLLALNFIHWSALFLYILFLIYSSTHKHFRLFVVSTMMLSVNYIWGLPLPKMGTGGNFMEILGINATILSPFIFIYIFYALYRISLRGDRGIIWGISFISLLLSFVLSVSFRVKITDFSPYIMIGIIPMVQVYYSSLRVRMRRHQFRYKLSFNIVTISLIVSTLSIILNQPIYRIVGKDNYSIVSPIYEPYDGALKLLKDDIKCTKDSSGRVLYQMRFYGINKCF